MSEVLRNPSFSSDFLMLQEQHDHVINDEWEAGGSPDAHEQTAEVLERYSALTPVELDGPGKAYVIPPTAGDTDETKTLVLTLPYLNGFTPHHMIRAETLQETIAPQSRVVVLPNNSFEKRDNVTYTDEQQNQLRAGNARGIGEVAIRTLEDMDDVMSLGELWLTGYSQGGTTVLAAGAVGSDRLNITRINADETPSKSGRSGRKLLIDFATSGSDKDLKGAIADSNIGALQEIMNPKAVQKDVIKFMRFIPSDYGRMISKALCGTASELLEETLANKVDVKVGAVAGSKVCDIEDLVAGVANIQNLRARLYEGSPFNRRHATADNVRAHALMAADGFFKIS